MEGRGRGGVTGQSHKAGPSSLSVALTLPKLSRHSQGLRLDSDHAYQSASPSLKGSGNPWYYFQGAAEVPQKVCARGCNRVTGHFKPTAVC